MEITGVTSSPEPAHLTQLHRRISRQLKKGKTLRCSTEEPKKKHCKIWPSFCHTFCWLPMLASICGRNREGKVSTTKEFVREKKLVLWSTRERSVCCRFAIERKSLQMWRQADFHRELHAPPEVEKSVRRSAWIELPTGYGDALISAKGYIVCPLEQKEVKWKQTQSTQWVWRTSLASRWLTRIENQEKNGDDLTQRR